jgi:hypothetical protein
MEFEFLNFKTSCRPKTKTASADSESKTDTESRRLHVGRINESYARKLLTQLLRSMRGVIQEDRLCLS